MVERGWIVVETACLVVGKRKKEKERKRSRSHDSLCRAPSKEPLTSLLRVSTTLYEHQAEDQVFNRYVFLYGTFKIQSATLRDEFLRLELASLCTS